MERDPGEDSYWGGGVSSPVEVDRWTWRDIPDAMTEEVSASRKAEQVLETAVTSMTKLVSEKIEQAPIQPTAKLLPVMRPEFNLRECAKNLALLEDHLAQERRRCKDCIVKHFSLVEAFAEEARALDPTGPFSGLASVLAEYMRVCASLYLTGRRSADEIAKDLREIRKPLLVGSTEWIAANKYEDRDGAQTNPPPPHPQV